MGILLSLDTMEGVQQLLGHRRRGQRTGMNRTERTFSAKFSVRATKVDDRSPSVLQSLITDEYYSTSFPV